METQKSILKITTIVLLVLLSSSAFLALASAKNLNLPAGADWIEYYNAGGTADIAITTVPTGFPSTTTAMEFRFVHVEMPNSDVSFDSLIVFIYAIQTVQSVRSWIPIAVITTSADAKTQAETFWSGTPMKLDASLYSGTPFNIPPSLWVAFSTNNVKLVSEDALKVQRHGNDVTVNLNTPQTIKRALSTTTFTLPAFNLELKNYGESIHHLGQATMTGYKGASGYTIVHDEVGFKATGMFTTSTASVLFGAPVQDATLWMHGSHTFYPPTA
jgi:hypothetical protein